MCSRLLINRFLVFLVFLMSIVALRAVVSVVIGVDVVDWTNLTPQNSFHRIILQVMTFSASFWFLVRSFGAAIYCRMAVSPNGSLGTEVVEDVAGRYHDSGRLEDMSGKASRLPTMMKTMREFLIAIGVS